MEIIAAMMFGVFYAFFCAIAGVLFALFIDWFFDKIKYR